MEVLRRLFIGRPLQEQVREWQRKLRSECRNIDRQLSQLSIQENKTKQSIKKYASEGSSHTTQASCRLLTKELIRAKKQRSRLEYSKALLNSLNMQLDEQLATLKIAGILQKSTIMIKDVNKLIRLPELNETMMAISKEMMKAGIFEEMVSDALDMEDLDQDTVETKQIDQILFEITDGLLGSIEPAPTTQINTVEETDQEETSLEHMRHRLKALRN
ncbi:unnamed protein product [Pneumocystis jirovecii]|uniref:Vacuolar protein sorting-associated protein 24 n=1 Tax=Pneumocystis jirovecii TaxID=42068 RepID=L0PDN5_PNEJI|nr:unnamed protein product [Pneumocystis jirovecii]